jgi:hypothetical protein
MPTHIFKSEMESNILFDFLKPICTTSNNHYIVSYESMKIAKYDGHYDKFIQEITPYYHISKRKYLEPPTSYKRFLTIIRQICNFNNIPYKSVIKYAHSTSCVEYYIYFKEVETLV